MKKFNDETLMAFVDSELSEEERKEVELALASDPEALRKVERFRKTRTAIDKFADILSEPVPEHLIETIRRHEQPSEAIKLPERLSQGSWMRLAASVVIGISLGTFGTKYYLNQSQGNEAAIAASRIASLEEALKTARAEKETAQATTASAEKNVANFSRNLEVAMAEKEAALVKASKSKDAQQKMTGIKDLSEVFPLRLVDQALENGSSVSMDLQKTILAWLKADTLPVSVASETSELFTKSIGTVPLTEAVETGSSKDFKDRGPAKAGVVRPLASLGPSKNPLIVLGEFSVAGKTCRLFEYDGQGSTRKLVLVACKKGAGNWEIVQRQNLR